MPNSAAFSELRSGIVDAQIICNKVPKGEPKTDLHYLKIRSLILLSHAVLEQYLEKLSLEVAQKSIDRLTDERVLTLPMLSLISAHKSKLHECVDCFDNSVNFFQSMEGVGNAVISAHEKVVEDNHGIKATNQDKIFHPLGIDTKATENLTLRAALDSYGSKRGSVAHNWGITTIHTRGDIESDLKTITEELATFDERVVMLSEREYHSF